MVDAYNAERPGHIRVTGLCMSYGEGDNELEAVRDLSFEVKPGEFVCFLGTSGCGKSTILNCLAGFVRPAHGEILLDGDPVVAAGPERGMVFQRHALFPWKTVLGNVEFGLKRKGLPRLERRDRAQRFIDMVGLSGFESRYPPELSGGMEQRVGLARVLALDPFVLLMDEPFGSLDAQTRMTMQELLLDVWEKTRKTVVFVTHDVDEAILLSDRIVVLTARPGSLREELRVDLTRPRAYKDVTSPDFIRIKEHALKLIRDESANAGVSPAHTRTLFKP